MYFTYALGLRLHLQKFPLHYCLFQHLSERDAPPTEEEKDIASGQKTLDHAAFNKLVGRLDKAADQNICDAFNRQTQQAIVSRICPPVGYNSLIESTGLQVRLKGL